MLRCRHHAKIVKRHGAAVVVMAFDEEGQAANFDEKVWSVCCVLPYSYQSSQLLCSGLFSPHSRSLPAIIAIISEADLPCTW